MASNGGDDQPPAWFLNLEADPHAHVQVKADKFDADVRVATDDEKPEMWAKMTAAWPHYDEYQAKTDRQIPVVVLQPPARPLRYRDWPGAAAGAPA